MWFQTDVVIEKTLVEFAIVKTCLQDKWHLYDLKQEINYLVVSFVNYLTITSNYSLR